MLGYFKCPLRLGSVLLPTLSWTIRRSNTNDTGPVSLVRYPATSMSPQWWPRLLSTCCVLTLCVVRKRSANWSTIQSCAFLAPEWAVHVLRWSPRGSNWNFLHPEVARGFSTITGIWAPIDVEKNVCQRLADQDSSRRWVLICPSQLIALKKRIPLGSSSSWDSRSTISVLRTDSSTVATMRWRQRKLNCSVWREPTYLSLRSRNSCQWSRICLVTLNWEGMTVTSTLESEISSRTKEDSMRRLSCGSERGTGSWRWETPSWEFGLGPDPMLTCDWELGPAPVPTLTCDWDYAQTSL